MDKFTHYSRLIISLLAFPAAAFAAGPCSPIVLDLGKDGIKLGDQGVGVYFDVNADGVQDHVQWVRPRGDEVFLAVDRNGNGIVDDGSELFGVGTPLFFDGGYAPNGFVGLAQYDLPQLGGNDDGRITKADQIWTELYVWKDGNADGKSVRSEMFRPGSVDLTAFETIPKYRKYFDAAGNAIPYWGWATSRTAPKKALMVDVFFSILEEQSALCTRPSPALVEAIRATHG